MNSLPDNLITGRTAKLPTDWKKQPDQVVESSHTVYEHHRVGNTITITVYGEPLGKPRMTRQDKWKQRPRVMRYREWCNRLRPNLPPDIKPEFVVDLSWIAYFEPPKSWSKKKRVAIIGQLHRSKPDRDNIDKAILDCLFKSDSAIANGTLRKVWGTESKIVITIIVES